MAMKVQGGRMVERMNPRESDEGGYTPANQLRKGDRVRAIGSYERVSRGMQGILIDVGGIYHWVQWQGGDKLPIRFNLVKKVG